MLNESGHLDHILRMSGTYVASVCFAEKENKSWATWKTAYSADILSPATVKMYL